MSGLIITHAGLIPATADPQAITPAPMPDGQLGLLITVVVSAHPAQKLLVASGNGLGLAGR